MAIIVWDERTYKIYVRCRPNEEFAPDEQLTSLVSEANKLSNEYAVLADKLTQLFKLCEQWNLKHDEEFRINHKAQLSKFKPKQR
jgi:hypothetical protein